MRFKNWLLDLPRRVRHPFSRKRQRVLSRQSQMPVNSRSATYVEALEQRSLLSGVQTFGDGFGALVRSNSGDGTTTLDFSAVTGGLVVTVSGDNLTVSYADSNRSDLLMYSAGGQGYEIIGSQGSDQFLVVGDGQLTSIDAGPGKDSIRFDSTTGVARSGADTIATRGDSSTFTLTGIESLTGHVSLGSALRGEINQAFDRWTGVATEFVQSEVLSAKIPFLNVSLAQALNRGFDATAVTVPSLADAKSYALDLLTIQTAPLAGFANLGALASGLESLFNSVTSGSPFTVTAGIHDWSELRFDVSFDASRSFAFAPTLSPEITAALGAAGIELSAFSNLDVRTRLGGSVEVGIRLDELTTLDGASGFADRGFLRLHPLSVEVDSNFENLSVAAGLSAQVFGSAATVNVVNGTVNLDACAELSLDPNGADGSGRFTLATLAASPAIQFQASGSLDARLPLSVTLGQFDLSQYGTPILILATDSLFEYRGDGLLITTPAVSLDVSINPALAERLLDLLGQVRDLGQKLPMDLFNKEIPGLGQSLNQLLTNSASTVEAGGLGGTFKLKDAVGHYFYSDYSSATGIGFTFNLGISVRGMLDALNRALASLTQVKFSIGDFDWSGKNLAGFDFSAFRLAGGLSLDFLRGFNFSGADLRGVNFSGLDLTGIDFSGARFDFSTNFFGSILRWVNFSGCDLRGVDFSGLDLRWADFSGSWLDGAKFNFALAFDVNWANVRFSIGKLPNVGNLLSNFDLTSLFGASSGWKKLSFGLDLSGWSLKNWSRFDLSGLDFSGVNLSGFNLSGVNLRGVSFHGATLNAVNFSGAFAWDVHWGTLFSSINVNISGLLHNLSLPNWSSSSGTSSLWGSGLNLSGFNFSGWDLSGLNFTGITFTGADFSGAKLFGVRFLSFDVNLNFSFADFRGFDLSGLSELLGKFRGANFSGLNFNGITFGLGSIDFSGANFSGCLNLGGLFSGLSGGFRRLFDGVSFGGVDFSGLLPSIKLNFKFGSFKGINFEGAILDGLDFTDVDFSFGWFKGTSINGAKFDGTTLLGTDLSGTVGDVASAVGAFFDKLSKLPTSWTTSASFMANLNPVVIEDIFATGAPGPAFTFSGGVKFNNNQVDLGIHLQANIDRSFSTDFSLSGDDLPPAVAAVLPTMELSGTAFGRGVLALDFDLGVLLGLRDTSVAGLFTVPLPSASSLDPYFKLNRFDVGASLGVSGLHASLAVAGLGSVGVDDVALSLMVGGRVALSNSQGTDRLRLSDIKVLRAADPTNWFKNLVAVTPSAKFDAGFTVTVDSAIQVGGQSFTAVFGDPIVKLATDQLFKIDEQGTARLQGPAVTLDVALTATQRDMLLEVLDQLRGAGDGALESEFLTKTIPGIGKSLKELFTVSADGGVLQKLFALTDAARDYFNGTNLPTDGNAAGPATATIRGLASALNEAVAKAGAMPFQPVQPEWAGAKLAFTNFTGLDLRGFNFVGADLHGANFAGADLTGVDFSGANLSGATFATYDGSGNVTSGAVLRDANFGGAQVASVSFKGLDLRGASFAETDLRGVNFSAASLIAANFANSVVDQTTSVAKAFFAGPIAAELVSASNYLQAVRLDPASGIADLSGYLLDGFDLSLLDLSRANFTNARLAGANLREAVLDGATFVNTVIDQAFIYKAKFSSAFSVPAQALAFAKDAIANPGSLAALVKTMQSGTSLAGFDLSGMDLSGIVFTGIDLAGAKLAGVKLAGAQLAGAILSDATDFTGAALEGISSLPSVLKGNFERAGLTGIDFTGKVLDHLNLSGANLTGAVLTNASLALADLRGAVLVNLQQVAAGTGQRAAAEIDALKTSLAGAVYDKLTHFNAAQAATLQAAMAPFELDNVFEEGASGPAFAFLGGLTVTEQGIGLSLNLQVNIDTEVSQSFSLSAADLPDAAQSIVPDFSMSGLATARLVTALNVDLGVDLARGSGSTFAVETDTWLRLNRFDAGARVVITGLDADLSVAGLANVQVRDGVVDLRVAAQVELNDPDDADGTHRLTSADRAGVSFSELVDVATTSNLRGRLTLNAQGAGFNLHDFGVPTVIFRAPDLIHRDLETGVFTVAKPDVFLDVRIGTALKEKILDVLQTVDDTGNGALSADVIQQQIPGLGRSVGELIGIDLDADGRAQTFKLRDATEEYLNGFTYAANDFPSLSGLTDTLRLLFAKDFSIPFNTTRTDWSGFDFSGYDFSGFSFDALRGFNFSGCNLSFANFKGLDLSGINFSGVNLSGALFDVFNLFSGINWSGANLTGINWSGIDLRGFDFSSVDLSFTNFSGFDLSGINFSGANLVGINFSFANLRWCNFIGCDLSGVNLSFAFAIDVDWSSFFRSDLTFDFSTNCTGMIVDRDLHSLFGDLSQGMKRLQSGLNLSGFSLNWSGWDLSGIDFSGINLSGINFSFANLRGVKFNFANLSFANFSFAFAFDVDWTGSTGTVSDIGGMISKVRAGSLPSASTGVAFHFISGLTLSGYNWSRWDLSGIDFSGFHFDNINWSWTDLTEVNFTGTTFGLNLNWSGSIWNGVTLPSGTLSGLFGDVDFSGFTFNPNINWNLSGYLPEFSGIKLSGSIGSFHFFSKIFEAWNGLGLNAPKLNFHWADFDGLDLTGLLDGLTFQFGNFKGVSFKGFKLPTLSLGDWDFSGLNLSLSNWTDFTFSGGIGGSTKLKLDRADVGGADFSGLLDKVSSAAGAFFDKLTSFGGFSTTFVAQLGMNEVVVGDVLGTPLAGPPFQFTPIFRLNGTDDVTVGFQLIVNQDLQQRVDFAIGLDDLGLSGVAAMGSLDIAGTAAARLVVKLDTEVLVKIPLRNQTIAGITLPTPQVADAEVLVDINRFDVGASAGVYGFSAELGLGDSGSVHLRDGQLSLDVAGQLSIAPAADTNMDGYLSLSEVRARRTADPVNWYKQLLNLNLGADFEAHFTIDVNQVNLFGSGVILNGTLMADIDRNATSPENAVTPSGIAVTVTIDDGSLSLPGFIDLNGDFALQSTAQNVTLADGTIVLADMLRIGGHEVNAFVGMNGPYLVDSDADGDIDGDDTPNADAVGLALSDVEFGAALMSARPGQAGFEGVNWKTLQATAGSVALVGIPDVTLAATGLEVQVNQVKGLAAGVDPSTRVVNFSNVPLTVMTGPTTTVSLDLDGSRGPLQRATGHLDVGVADFFNVSGDFAFEKSLSLLTLADGQHVEAELLTIGASGSSAFAGLNGGSADQLGLSLSDVGFALVVASDQSTPSRSWTALKANAGSIELTGLLSISATGENVSVEINRAAGDGSLIDFLAQPLEIPTGLTTTQTLSMDGSVGSLIRASGTLDIAVGDFVQFSGDVAFETSRRNNVSLADGSSVNLDQLIIGTNGVSAFAGNNGGTDNAVGFNLEGVDLALILSSNAAQPSQKWTSLQADARTVEFVGLPSITASGTDLSVAFNRASSGENVIDFSASPQLVTTGPGSSVMLEMPGSAGNLSRATGHLDLAVAGFFSVTGDFGFEQSIRTVKLSDGSEIAVDLLSLGASDTDAFIGLNGGSENAIGFEATGVNFGLVLATDRANEDREFLLLQATVESAAFSGGDGLSITVGEMSVTIADTEDSDVVLDFSATPLVIATGASSSVTLDFDGAQGEIVQVEAHADLDIFGFVQVSGDFAFKKSEGSITLTDESKVEADLLAIGATGADAFIGLNGGTDGALGFAATDVEFALLLATDQEDDARTWTTLLATAGSVGFVGSDDLTLSGTDLSVELTRASAGAPQIDFLAEPVEVATGPGSSITIDLDTWAGPITRASGHLDLAVGGFFQATGDFVFEKTTQAFTLSDSSTVQTDVLLLGASGVSAFVGNNGGTADAAGFAISEVDFALALASDPANPARNWTALKATAFSIGFVGIEGITATGSDLSVEINRASGTSAVLDLNEAPLLIRTGPVDFMSLDFDGASGELTRAQGHTELDLFGFFAIDGDFGFEKSIRTVNLSDTSVISADVVTFGARGASAFVGLNGGTDERLGLAVDGVDFGLALMTDRANRKHTFTTLQATAENAGFEGLDALQVAVSDVSIAINRGITVLATLAVETKTNTVLDFVLTDDTLGTVAFSFGGESRSFTATGIESNQLRRQKITQTLESLPGIGAGNVRVTGDSYAGFRIEFIGDRAGEDLSSLTTTTTEATPSSTVTQITAATAGLNEIKYLTFDLPRQQPSPIDAAVTTIAQPTSATGGGTTIYFTNPYSASGYYDLKLGNRTVDVRYAPGDVTNNAVRLRAGIASVLNTSTANVTVQFDQNYHGTHRYFIDLGNVLSGQSLSGLQVVDRVSSGLVYLDGTYIGSPATAEQQLVSLSYDEDATGRFQLSLQRGASTFTTSELPLRATAAAVQSALNAALSGTGANITVVDGASESSYLVTFGGSLFNENVNRLTVSASVDSPAPSGSFTISVDGEKTSPIEYSTDTATFADNIEAALFALTNIGTNNVVVVFDAAKSGDTHNTFRVEFINDRANENIPDFSTNSSLLSLTRAIPTRENHGRSPVAEGQRIVIGTPGLSDTVRISLTHNGQTYQSDEFSRLAETSDVQTAINNGFASLSGANVTVGVWTGTTLKLSFGGTLAGVDVADVVVDLTVNSVDTQLTVVTAGNTVTTPGVPEHDVVADFSNQSLFVITGADPFELNLDGAAGELTEASGHVSLNIAEFVTVEGDFAFRKGESQVTLDDESKVDVSLLTIGATGVTAFVGLNGGTPEAIGFGLSGVEFGLVVAQQDIADGPDRQWFALKATAESGGLLRQRCVRSERHGLHGGDHSRGARRLVHRPLRRAARRSHGTGGRLDDHA